MTRAACAGSYMVKQLPTIILGLAVAGCAYTPAPVKPGNYAWDGLGRDPNLRGAISRARPAAPEADQNIERERVLATLQSNSAAWWVVHDEIEAETDRRLNAKLLICQGCLAEAPDATAPIR